MIGVRGLLTGVMATLLCMAIAVPAQAETADTAPGGLPGIAVPSISWQDCGGGFECSTVPVPRDYRHPRAASIPLAVNRHRAADSAHRIGALFVNPGGPGGSGVGFARSVVSRFPAVADR